MPTHEDLKELKAMARRRYNSNTLRMNGKIRESFSFEDGLNLLIECFNSGFCCYYCEEKLVLKDKKPYLKVPSIDHKIPLSLGGSNDISNCVVCCHRCNIVKGTLTANTFGRLLHMINLEDPDLLDKLFEESFKGKLAYKLERLRVEKEFLEND